MSQFGSQRGLNIVRRGSRPDLTGAGTYYARSEVVHGGNGFGPEYMDGYNTYTYSKGSMGGGLGQGQGPSSPSALSAVHQKAYILQGQCQEYLRKAEFCLQSGGDGGRASGEAERYMAMARETIEGMKACAVDLRQMGQPNDSVIRSVEICRGQLKEVHMVISGSLHRRNWGSKGSGGGGWEDPGRSFQEAMAWIGQQKRLIETSPWGDDSVTIEQQLNSHNKFHSCIQRSVEVDRARDELMKKGDKANLHSLDQEWDSLQKMSFGRTDNLRELQSIIEQISKEIIWVNEREEEELVFDWGDRNIDVYIPEKQESYSKLMSALEEKEKDLNKLKTKVDVILKNNHPAADKIEAYMDTLQTQWSWLLQITKCIYTHLKENAAYSQFFKEANETYSKLQKEHDTIRKKFTCDKNTPLDNLQELIKGLEREKERIVENKRQVQHLVNKSKSIVRLRPRNPDEKSSSPVIVEALCDFKQDQKVICKGNDAILKDNSQRSKWLVTGPGGLDMVVPSVCLLVPPPNPLSINLASKNEQYYEAILTVWNQLYINIKSLISWQYCVQDITRINSLTLTMLARMRPDEYRSLIQTLETRYEEFKLFSRGSQMFGDEDRRSLETQYSGAQTHYDQLVVQLPAYTAQQQQLAKEEELRKKKEAAAKKRRASSHSLTELHALRARLDTAEAGLTQHVHVCLGEDGAHDCGLRIVQLEAVQLDIESARDEYQRLRERIQKELEGMTDSDKAHFLRSEVSLINQRLSSLEGSSSAYLQRLRALRALLESVARCEDIVKVHEARLTEKETTSLDSAEVDDYESTLKGMRAELELKRDVLVSMETELAKAVHWNDQVGGAFHRCDVDLSKYGERVAQLTDRWRRIQGQIDSRLSDLAEYLHQLQRYRGSSSAFSQWVDSTRLRLDALQAAKIDDIAGLNEHLSQQRALNSEIKGKRDDVESVVRDNDACVASIKDYELELATYGAGLETLLNIPFKRTVLQSPSTQLTQEATLLQTHYIELLTLSGDYYKYLGEMLKNMEELKMRDTRIDLLEEELRLLKEDVEERRANSRSLEEVILRYRLELTQSQQHLLSAEEVQRSTALECTSTQDSLDSAHGRLREAGDQATRLAALIEEEKRKRRLAEERFGEQREELEAVLRRRQKELEEANWAKLEAEKSAGDGEREAERLRRLLAEETGRGKRLEQELSKVRSKCITEIGNLKQNYESQIQISRADLERQAAQLEEDGAALRAHGERTETERRELEEEVRRLRLSSAQAEEQKRRAEEEAHGQRAAAAEEARRGRGLEAQVEALLRQRGEDGSQHSQELGQAAKSLKEKSAQLAHLAHNLEEESVRRRVLEEERVRLEQALAQVKSKQASSSAAAAARLGPLEEEAAKLRLQLEKESDEKARLEQSAGRLQGRVRDLQATRDALEAEVAGLRKGHQEEVARKRRAELELEKSTAAMREYTGAIATLRQSQEEAGAAARRADEERGRLQKELERSGREHKASAERVTQLAAELKAAQQQLIQEQGCIREGARRHDGLHKTLEEKSRALNESLAELGRQRGLTETLSGERLRLEEELRAARREREELLAAGRGGDDKMAAQLAALELQLESSARSGLQHQSLVAELSAEREKLRLEIEQTQKQAVETSSMIQSIQTRYADLLAERDALLAKLKLSDQDKARSLKLEEELNSVKLSLESELRLKRRLQEENEQVKKDFLYWKGQCDSEKERLERERSAMRRETERLTRELRVVEETHKSWQLLTQTELTEMTSARAALEAELRALRERPDALAKHTQTDESPAAATLDPSVLIFVGVRKTVTAQQLLDCRVIDKPTFNQLLKGQRTVSEVSVDIKLNLKGTGIIAGVCAGPRGKMSFTEARKANLLSADSAILLLEAQAATGHMVDPGANEKLTVSEALARGVVDEADAERLLAAEAAAVGYRDPNTAKLLSAGQAMRKGLIDRDAALRLLQAQESVGGILDPALSVFLPKDAAVDRDLIDEDLYRALNQRPECYLDPDTQMAASYVSLKRKCKVDPSTGLLLIPEPEKPVTVQGLREPVNVWDLVDAKLLEPSDLDQLRAGKLTSQDIETRLRSYLRGSASIAGVYDEASGRILPIYQAMKEGILRPGTTLELLEAQAASGFMIDPVDNLYLTVNEAYKKGLHGPEFKEKLLSAERAVTGYKDPGTDKIISLFQAIEKGLIEKGHGIRLLEAQIASGGIIDPHASHRIEVDVAYKKGYFGKEMNRILTDEGDDTKGFFDPNTEENLTYLELKRRCIMDKNTGLVLLPIKDKKNKSTQKNTLRKRRVVIVDPDTNKEMTVQEAYDKKLIDYETFLELSGQECEWEEITITAPDGSVRLVIIDRKTGRQYDIQELLEQGVIGQSVYEQYRAQTLTLTQFADVITSKSKAGLSSSTAVAPPASSATATSAAGAKSSSSATTSSATTSSAKSSSATTSSAITSSSAATSSSATTSSAITSSSAAKSSTTTSSATTSSAKSSSATTPSAITSSSAAEKSSSGTTPSAITSSSAAEKSSSGTTPSAITSSAAAAAATSAAEAASKSTSSLFSSSTSSQRTMTSTTTRSIITAESSTLISSTTISGSSSQHAAPLSPSTLKHMSSVSITLASPAEGVDEQTPVGAIFDMEALEKISISEALKRGLVDSITAQRLLEAQACTGGIINPANGRRMGIQEAFRNGIIEDDMATRLKPAQKAYIGFEDVKSKKKMSAAEAMKEKWLPYEAGHRFLEFQYATGGLFDPELGRKRTIEEALQVGWLDGRSAQKLQDTRHHGKNLTCPKTKLKISYKEAMDNCLVEETTGVRMLQAATSSSKGISSPYNVSSAPGSASGSRSGSRRGSMDLGSSGRYSLSSYSRTSSFSSRSLC